MLKLFKISLTDVDYDDYDGAIVAAKDLSQVKDLAEYGNEVYDSETHSYIVGERFKREDGFERRSSQKYTIEEIGTTTKYKEPTIILSSFNAG